jgi:osmotically-inducible protein OsmY
MDDQSLRQTIAEELEWAPHVDAARITIAVHNGIVQLGGVVESLAEKHAAERAVWHVRGVRGLVQEIAVEPPSSRRYSDDEIAERVASVLRWDAQIPDAHIRFKVAGGIVTLIGTLEWQYQKQEAEARTQQLEGVLAVDNEIVVRPGAATPDIASKVHRALARHAELDASRIAVAVEGATVTLSGEVPSLVAWRTAENAAWSAAGVAAVENQLSVVP